MTPQPPWLHGGDRGRGRGPGPEGPQPQELYDIDSNLPGFRDVHPGARRPSLVLRLIPDLRMVNVITRTTDLNVDGVPHNPDSGLGLDEPGTFAKDWVQTLETRLFVYPLVDFLGVLDDNTWRDVVQMWESL